MKKVIFSICVMLIAITSYGKPVSESKVPVLVKNSFYQDYPQAEHVKWEITTVDDYKASFKIDDDYGNAYYTNQGKFIESDISIEWKDVPLTGRMEIYHLKRKGHITGVLKIINSNQDKFYLIDVKRIVKHYEILLDHEGNIVKTGKY